jgi:hypothetical protein
MSRLRRNARSLPGWGRMNQQRRPARLCGGSSYGNPRRCRRSGSCGGWRQSGTSVRSLLPACLLQERKFYGGIARSADHVVMVAPVELVLVTRHAVGEKDGTGQSAHRQQLERGDCGPLSLVRRQCRETGSTKTSECNKPPWPSKMGRPARRTVMLRPSRLFHRVSMGGCLEVSCARLEMRRARSAGSS